MVCYPHFQVCFSLENHCLAIHELSRIVLSYSCLAMKLISFFLMWSIIKNLIQKHVAFKGRQWRKYSTTIVRELGNKFSLKYIIVIFSFLRELQILGKLYPSMIPSNFSCINIKMLVDYSNDLSHTTLYHLSYVSRLLIIVNRPREAWETWI